MTSKISLLLPTRQRPDMFKRFYNSAMELADDPDNIEVVAYIDEDDGHYDDINLPRLIKVRGERIVLSEMWNKCWESAAGEIFGHMGDDIVFRTKGWDSVVRNLFAQYSDKIVFVYGNDGNGESERNQFGTHGFIHKNWTDTIGYFVPPYFSSDYNDCWLNDVAKGIERHVHVDILTEHMHYTLGKSEIDQNTKDRLSRHSADRVEDIYDRKFAERLDDMEKLRQVMQLQGPFKWTILIATIGQRKDRLQRLLDTLMPQVEKYEDIEVLAYWNNGEEPMGKIRQRLVEEARGEYVSFIDDDDLVPEYYCDKVRSLLDGVDYIGWRMQVWHNGEKLKPTFHSLRYSTWSEDDNGFYRNISHLNPIKRQLALQADFVVPKGIAEDQPWVQRVAPFVKNEHYIDDVMYFYHHTSEDSVWRGDVDSFNRYERLDYRHPQFKWHSDSKEVWDPEEEKRRGRTTE